jgi:hypothetical protein
MIYLATAILNDCSQHFFMDGVKIIYFLNEKTGYKSKDIGEYKNGILKPHRPIDVLYVMPIITEYLIYNHMTENTKLIEYLENKIESIILNKLICDEIRNIN